MVQLQRVALDICFDRVPFSFSRFTLFSGSKITWSFCLGLSLNLHICAQLSNSNTPLLRRFFPFGKNLANDKNFANELIIFASELPKTPHQKGTFRGNKGFLTCFSKSSGQQECGKRKEAKAPDSRRGGKTFTLARQEPLPTGKGGEDSCQESRRPMAFS